MLHRLFPSTWLRSPPGRCLLAALLLAAGTAPLRSDVVLEESYELTAGWSLIHVPLEPLEKGVKKALEGVDWVSLWTWLPDIPFGNAPDRGGRWLAAHRDEPAFLSSLASFTGPTCYAILTESAGTLRVKGHLRSPSRSLRGFAFHLFGPSISGSSPPSLAGYFSRPGVLEQLGGKMYGLAGGVYSRLSAGDLLRPGAAYWLRTAQDVPEPDPLRVLTGRGGLRFSAQANLQEVEIELGAAAGGGAGGGVAEPRRLAVRAIPSTEGTSPADWLDLQQPDGTFAPLTGEASVEVGPETARARLTLLARQEGAVAAGAARRSLALEVSGSAGSVRVGADLDLATMKGMWSGEASLTEVERPSFHGGGYQPAASLPVSIILEVPATGQPRLLPCAAVSPDHDDGNLTNRMNAALFPEAVPLLGTVAADGKSGTLRGTVTMDPEHPLNPYRHRYHPEHGEGFPVERRVTLRFGATLPGSGGEEDPLSTVGVVGGVYEEEINGLSREPIRVRGSFQIRGFRPGQAAPCSPAGQ